MYIYSYDFLQNQQFQTTNREKADSDLKEKIHSNLSTAHRKYRSLSINYHYLV